MDVDTETHATVLTGFFSNVLMYFSELATYLYELGYISNNAWIFDNSVFSICGP